MAVEARHLNLILPQSFNSRGVAVNSAHNYPPTAYGTAVTAATSSNPRYGFPITNGDVKSESGVTYAAASNSRKRRRDDCTVHDYRDGSSLVGEDLAFQIHQQQLDVDRIVAQHTERLRIEIEERRRRYSRQMAEALAHHIKKQLKSKDEELAKIGKLNAALEERVKSLAVENQMWRDLAQTNEAAANALRRKLEQVLSERQHQHHRRRPEEEDDARSFCGSNYYEEENRRARMCRRCEGEEACVLLLPCRHMCVCTVCGSATHACPICHSIKTATVHVNVLP